MAKTSTSIRELLNMHVPGWNNCRLCCREDWMEICKVKIDGREIRLCPYCWDKLKRAWGQVGK
jgi:ribosome-binding protein aMBF1 (putative translation factor)